MEKENQTIECNISTKQICEDEGSIWFASNEGNLLCRWDKADGIIYKACFLPNINKDIKGAYQGICKWNDYVIVAPFRTKAVISVYHVKKKTLQEIWLQDFKNVADNDAKFMMCFSHGKYVYLIGYEYPAIVRLNMESLEPEYITDWILHMDDGSQSPCKAYLAYGTVVGSVAILPLVEKPGILKLDLDTGETRIVAVPSTAKGFNSVNYAKGKIWLVDAYESKLVIWDPDVNVALDIWIDGEDKKQAFPFWKAAVVQDQLLLIPFKAKYAYWVSMESGDIQKCAELEPCILENRKRLGLEHAGCFPIMQNTNGLYVDFDKLDCFYFYRYSDKQWFPVKKTCDRVLAGILVSPKYKNVIVESEEPKLEELLQDLVNVDFPDIDREKPKAIGERIYWTLKV